MFSLSSRPKLPVVLTSCLLAVSFSIVNCQKAPNRNGVKAKPGAVQPGSQKLEGATAATTEEMKQQLAATQACGDDLLKEYKKLIDGYNQKKINQMSVVKKSEVEVEKVRTTRVEFLDQCQIVSDGLQKFEENSCIVDMKKHETLKEDAAKARNALGLLGITRLCETVYHACKKEHTGARGCDTKYKPTPVTDGNRVAGTGERESNDTEAFKKANLQLSKNAIEMTAVGKARFSGGNGFVGGKIVTNALEEAKKGKVACAFSRNEVLNKDKPYIFNVNSYDDATFSEQDVNSDLHIAREGEFKGDAVTMVLTRVNDKSEADGALTQTLVAITCLNQKKGNLSIKKIMEALGIARAENSMIKMISTADLEKIKKENEAKRQQAAAGGSGGGGAAAAGNGGGAANGGQAAPPTGGAVQAAQTPQAEVAKAKEDLTRLENESKSADAEMEKAKAAVKAQEELITGKNTQIKDLDAEVKKLKAELDALVKGGAPAGKKEEKAKALKEAELLLGVAQNELVTLQDELLQKRIVSEQKTMASVRALKSVAEQKIKLVAAEAKVAGSESAEMKTRKEKAQEEIKTADSKLTEIATALANLVKQTANAAE